MVMRTPKQLSQDILDQSVVARNLAALVTDPSLSSQANGIAASLSQISPLVAVRVLAPPISPLGYPAPPPPFPLPPSAGFQNNGGLLELDPPTGAGYPMLPGGLLPGSIWSNSGAVSIVPGFTPVAGDPVFFIGATPLGLLALGGAGLPLTNPGVTGQLWNNGNTVAIA